MCIYDKSIITEQTLNRYKPTRLYIKELAGVKYFGKTTKDPYTYHGSGVVWLKRIQKYGTDAIKTLWMSEPYDDPYEIQEIALHFSRENRIVESEHWANCKPEDGLDGGRQTDQTVKVIASKLRGQKRTLEQNLAKSKRQSGSKKSEQWVEKRSGENHYFYGDKAENWQRVCKHCGTKTNAALHTRWHDNNCHKAKQESCYSFERIDTGEKISVSARVLRSQYDADAARLISGSRKTSNGWRYLGPV